MRDTPLATIEIEMQLIPGFTPRAYGTFVNGKPAVLVKNRAAIHQK